MKLQVDNKKNNKMKTENENLRNLKILYSEIQIHGYC